MSAMTRTGWGARWLRAGALASATIAIALAVAPAQAVTSTTTSLSASPTTSNPGQSVTLTTTVAGASPSGTVTIKEGSSVLATANLGPEPYWDNVSLLLHADGANGSTAFVDASGKSTPAANGIAKIESGTVKFGSGGMQANDGSSDGWLTVPYHAGLNLASGDFTVEFWLYPTAITGSGQIVFNVANGTGYFPVQLLLTGSGNLEWRGFVGNGSGLAYDISSSALSLNAWHHAAAVRSGSTFTLYVDGAIAGTASYSGTLYSGTDGVAIGAYGTGGYSFHGVLDEIRVTKGVARYSAPFTPPASAFADSSGAPAPTRTATATINTLGPGTHNLVASYSGDANNSASVSSAVALTVNRSATTTTVNFSQNPGYVHQYETLWASVTGWSPGGTVTFRDGANTIANVAVTMADPNWSKVSLQVHADGADGSTTFTDTSGKSTVTANGTARVQTAVAKFGTGALQTNYGGTVGWLSVPYNAGIDLSSGDFTVECWLYETAANSAIVMNMASGTGYYPWQLYIGSGGNLGLRGFANGGGASTVYDIAGPVVSLNVWHHVAAVRAGSSLTLYLDGVAVGSATYSGALYSNNSDALSIGAYGSGTYGFAGDVDEIRITKGVARYTAAFAPPSAPFPDGASGGSGYPVGSATYSTNALSVGTHAITASYSGDPNNTASATAVVNLPIQVNPTTVSLVPNATSLGVGQGLTLVAKVAGDNPTGTVTFKDGARALGTVALNAAGSASLSTSLVTQGAHSLVAAYSGDTYNAANPSAVTSITATKAPTTTSVSASTTTPGTGQPVVLTATVSGGFNAGGTVTFSDGGATLPPVPVVGGVAVFTTSYPASGTHTLSASYSGDANNETSVSSNLSVSVEAKWRPTVTIKAGPNPTSVGQNVTLTAAVTGKTPTGLVKFFDGGTLLNQVSLSGNSASLTVSSLKLGSHALSATYAGDGNNYPADSNLVGIQVDATAPVAPGQMTWVYGYDAEGNPTTALDPNGNETVTAYDRFQRAFTLTQPRPAPGAASPVVGFDYDGLDQLTKVTDPRGLVTRYTTDGLGNTTVLQSPDAGLKNATFDVEGKLLTRTDARGKTTVYAYDPLGRVTSINYAGGTPTQLVYDRYASANDATAIGHLTQITDESGSTTYRYDGLGHVVAKTQVTGSGGLAKSFTVAYGWGSSGPSAGKLTSITYPSGARANYSYDATGRLSGVTLNPVNANGAGTNTALSYGILASVQYNGASAVKGWTWGDGTAYARGFDAYARLNQYPLGNPAGSGASAGLVRMLGYDNAGRITAFTHSASGIAKPAFDQSFGYDGLDRLTLITKAAGGFFSYGYDANGNRSNRNISGSNYLNTIDPGSNRFTGVQDVGSGGAAVARTYGYDLAGNLTSDGVNTFGYSDRGRMSSATTPGGVVSYLYNGLEQRVLKSGPTGVVSTGAAYYVYDEAGHLLGEYDANGSPVHETVYIGMTPVAVVKQINPRTANVQTSLGYVYADHTATPRVVVRSGDHAIVWRWDAAEAFGATPPDQNPNGLGAYVFDQRMPGQVFDAETGSFDNGWRNYQPSTGTYWQSDPIGLAGGSISTFQYVNGNPLIGVDPNGLATIVGAPSWGASFGKPSPEYKAWYDKYGKTLNDMLRNMQDRINSLCPQERARLQAIFDRWKIRVDPNIDDPAHRGHFYATTKDGLTTFDLPFFQIQKYENPSQSFVGWHEYRHVMPENHAIYDPPSSIGDVLIGHPERVPSERDADDFARWMESASNKCGCPK
jgi:RHS repeat-associated protein